MNIRNKQILNLALPSIISNITVPLLGLVDLAIVGHLNNIALIGAVAVATTIFNVQYWLLGFLRMGTSGLTAQALGKRNFHFKSHSYCNLYLVAAHCNATGCFVGCFKDDETL